MSFVAEISLILETSHSNCHKKHPMDVCGHVSFVQFETHFLVFLLNYIYVIYLSVYRDRVDQNLATF